MLPLDSPVWADLSHAYGTAEDIPPLLKALEEYPSDERYLEEPWDTLWGSLCHQCDVYSASYAALPHILRVASAAPDRICISFVLMPAMIEASRQYDVSPPVPDSLSEAYFAAVRSLPDIVASIRHREWNDDWARAASVALCAAKGYGRLAYGILDLTPEILAGFPDWAEAERRRLHPPIPPPSPPPPYLSGGGPTFTQ